MGGAPSEALYKQIHQLSANGTACLVIDLREVEWINSSGLGTLIAGLTSLRNASGDLRLSNVRPRIRELLSRTKLLSVFYIYESADAAETAEAWRAALLRTKGPTALIFSRQDLPILDRTKFPAAKNLQHGAYTLWQPDHGKPDAILIATGSEVHIALEAADKLAAEGIQARVVSMLSWEIFDAQPENYRQKVLPSDVTVRVAIEAGIKLGWEHCVGTQGAIVGLESFGASAPASVLCEKFGITVNAVVAQVKNKLEK